MTNESILEAVNTWAKEKDLHYEAVILSAPPALLDLRPTLKPEELPADHSGVCLTIREPEATEEPPASLVCWIPVSGKGGSYLMCREGDGEIGTDTKDWFRYRAFTIVDHEEIKEEGGRALTSNLDSVKNDFYRDYIFVPCLQAWLESKGLKFEKIELTECSGEAIEVVDNPEGWHVVQFDDPWAGYPNPSVIGVTGWGEVGTFGSDDEGWTCFYEQAASLKSASELRNWLESTINLKN